MKVLLSIISLVIVTGCSSLDKKIKNNKPSFVIELSSCYDHENVDVYINGEAVVLNFTNVKSNESTGLSNVFFEYYEHLDKGKLLINDRKEKEEQSVFLNKNEGINLKVIRNGFENEFTLDLAKGWNILMSGCDEGYNNKVILEYHKKVIDVY